MNGNVFSRHGKDRLDNSVQKGNVQGPKQQRDLVRNSGGTSVDGGPDGRST